MPEQRLEESPWARVAAIVGGAGASALVASQVQKFMPDVGTEIAGAGTGLILYLYGDRIHPLVKYAGIGVIAGTMMPRVAEWFGGMMPEGEEEEAETKTELLSAAETAALREMMMLERAR